MTSKEWGSGVFDPSGSRAALWPFCLCLLLLAGGVAGAEPVGPQLETIVVTAKKRRQNVQNVPQTVDVIGGGTLQKFQLVPFQDLQQAVSGLQLSDNGGRGQNIALRGITYDPDTTANPAVDAYVNEVPLSQTSTAFQDLYDVDSVEVIRGPQGTLRGRTSPAGAILIASQLPSMQSWGGYAQQSFSDNGLFQTQFAAGGPVVPGKLAVRLAGLFDQNGLYGTHDVTTGKDDYNLQHSLRMTVEAKPIENLDVVLMHQESNDRTRQLFAVVGNGSAGLVSPEDNLAVHPGPYTFYNRSGLTTLQASLRLGGNEIRYTAGYQAVRDEFKNYLDKGNLLQHFDAGSQTLDQSLEQLTQEIQLQSSGERRLSYMLGAYYAHQDAFARVFTPSETLFFPGTPGAPYPGVMPVATINADIKIPQLVTNFAGFTDESFQLSPTDVLEGGLRWQVEEQYRASGYQVVIPAVFGGGVIKQTLISPNNQTQEYRAWTGLASYTHHFTHDVMLYANYGQSFRPGGVVLGISLPLPQSFLIYKPETSYDFEIGGKALLLGGRFRLNGDIFHQTYAGYIGRENNLYTTLGYQSITTNGDAVSQGAEMSVNALITDDWHFDFNTTYADSRYHSARLPCNDFAGTGQPNAVGTPRVTGPGIASYCITKGTLGTPNWYVNLNTEYDFPLGGGITLFTRGLYTFTPSTRLTLQAANQTPRNMMNLYLGARSEQGKWEVFAFVKNLFDTLGYTNQNGRQYDSGYLIQGSSFNFVNYDTGYTSSTILRRREGGVTLAYHF